MVAVGIGGRGYVAGSVRRHVAPARRAADVQVVRVIDAARRRLPDASYGRVRAVGAGHRTDSNQHVGVGHVRGARVTRAVMIVKKKQKNKLYTKNADVLGKKTKKMRTEYT